MKAPSAGRIRVIAVAESAALDIGAGVFGKSHCVGERRGDVGDARARLEVPLSPIKILALRGIKMIVGQGIPLAERGVIIADARHIEIIRIIILGADGGFLLAAGEGRRGQPAQQKEADALAPFHVRKISRSYGRINKIAKWV